MATHAIVVGYGFPGTHLELPGIERDVANTLEYAKLIGIPVANVTIFSDLNSIPRVSGYPAPYVVHRNFYPDFFKKVSQLPENSKLLIFFSTHGMQITDSSSTESDSKDECLLVRQRAQIAYIDDDSLNNLLLRALKPSCEALVLVDACNSGTVLDLQNKYDEQVMSVQSEVYAQAFDNLANSIGIPSEIPQNPATVVSISACRDDELANATYYGSVFAISVFNYFTGSTIFNNGAFQSTLQAQSNTVKSFIQLTESIEKYKIKVGASITTMGNFEQNCVVCCNKSDVSECYSWAFGTRSSTVSAPTNPTIRVSGGCSIL